MTVNNEYDGREDFEDIEPEGPTLSSIAGNEVVLALADLFTQFNLPHTLEQGWTTRNPSYNWYPGAPEGVMVHHVGSASYAPERAYPEPYGTRDDGTTNCCLLLQPDGTVNFISTDPANYSSGLNWEGLLTDYIQKGIRFHGPQSGDLGPEWYGNRAFVNIEVVHPGDGSAIPEAQEKMLVITCALLAYLIGRDSTCVVGHLDGRGTKIDPKWDGIYSTPPYSIAGIQDAVQAVLDLDEIPEGPDMTYRDVLNVPDWGKDAVDWGIDNGLININDENVDDFNRPTSDGRMWVFMHRFDQYLKSGREPVA